MRIDRAKYAELPHSKLQWVVNDAVAKGASYEQLLAYLNPLRWELEAGENKIVPCTLKAIVKPSNLKRGYKAFYICPSCQRTTLSLFYLDLQVKCRICHHLTYKKMDRRQCTINRLLVDENLAGLYYASDKPAYFKKALEAFFIKEAIEEKAGKEVAKIIAKDTFMKKKVLLNRLIDQGSTTI